MIKGFISMTSGFMKLSVIIFLNFFLIGSLYAKHELCECESKNIQDYFGEYEFKSYLKYGGGLTTETDLIGFEESVLVIEKEKFKYKNLYIKKPEYKLVCEPQAQVEGEVPVEKYSDFFGFNVNREVRMLFHIRDQEGRLVEVFEVVNGADIWVPYDGWFLIYMPNI